MSKFEIWVSQSCSLKFTILHSFFCPFSIFNFQVGIFYVWNNCDTKHMFWFAENLLCKLYHWTSKKTQKVCFHFKLFYKLKDQTKSFVGLPSQLHPRVVTRVRPWGCCQLFHHLHVSVMWRFLMLVSRKLGLLLDLFILDNSPRKKSRHSNFFFKILKNKIVLCRRCVKEVSFEW